MDEFDSEDARPDLRPVHDPLSSQSHDRHVYPSLPIVERLGAGAMGVVWKALDTRLDRDVALKFLPDSATTIPLRLERLVREARAASALNHPNIVTIYEINSDGDRQFIAMELIHGRTLSDMLKSAKPFPVAEAVGYMIQFCDGLAKAHAAHIVHRDIKPSNVMVTDDGLIKILDFGLARSVAEPSPLDATVSPSALTDQGVVMGTIPYMSPNRRREKRSGRGRTSSPPASSSTRCSRGAGPSTARRGPPSWKR